MASFQSTVITDRGHALMAKIASGTTKMSFTKIRISDTVYADAALATLTALSSIKQEVSISAVSVINTATVKVSGAISNAALVTGYYVQTIGLYAQDPDLGEILYSVTKAVTADWMPPNNGISSSSLAINLLTVTSNASNVTISIDPGAVASMADIENVRGEVEEVNFSLESHEITNVNTEDGAHGFRFFNDVLQFNDGSGNWIDIETGGGGIAPSNVSNASIKVGNGKLTIKWSDPGNTVVDGQLLCTWKGTKLVQKAGSFPTTIKDGTVLLDNQVKDAYATNGFEINGLTNGTTYYFQLFPYSDKNAVNENVANRLSAAPQPFKTMTAVIDLSNSNPATCITYADDAVGMTPGSAAWDEFFGHYPCLLNAGVEVGKLKTTDYTKFENGTAADITSGNAGDVMVAFPRRGVKITTVGTTMTIKMTDDPDNAGFEYLAHTRGSTRKEKFYLGAYKGNTISSKLRSLSGKTPTATQTIGTFRTQAQANGAGYEQSGFYQLMFRQAMYLLKYKNLNSQVAVGRGYVDGNSAAIATGGTNAKGMDFGETTGKLQMKLFGLEDFWGNVWEWIDGIVTTSTRNMLTATTGFNDTGSGYTDQGQGATEDIGGYMNKPQGSTKTGFLAKEVSGSETTYFCDYTYLYASCVADFGGAWSNASSAGAFRLTVFNANSDSYTNIAARLMYL